MNVSPFQFKDYRVYLAKQIEEHRQTRGYLTLLAKSAGCQLSYISHVISSKAHLTLDQAAGMCEFWNLNEVETDFFLELVNLGRCGSKSLRKVVERRIQSLKKNQENLVNRFEKANLMPEEYQSIYYSSWHWIAIHMATSISNYTDAKSIANRIGLPLHFVQNALVVLESLNLIKKESGCWKIRNADVHLPKSSPYTQINHLNWRQKSIANIQTYDSSAIHYTAVQTMTMDDLEVLKELIMEFISKSRKFGATPPEEEMICLTVDLFKV